MTEESIREGSIIPDEVGQVLDKMVLYEILAKTNEGGGGEGEGEGTGEEGDYLFGNKFLDFVDTMGKEIDAMPEIYEQLSSLDFVTIILIPRYLATLKLCGDDTKRLALRISDRYRPSKNDNPLNILFLEILEESKRIFNSYRESDELWSELWDISLMTHERFLLNFSQNYMLSLPDSVIKQLMK